MEIDDKAVFASLAFLDDLREFATIVGRLAEADASTDRRPISGPMTVFASATSGQRKDALHVWCAARTADGNPPSMARIDRVRRKLADTDASLLVGCDGERVVAMALSEPYRERHGAGTVRPHTGHVSMVFVDPECWGHGVGSRLLDALHREMRARDWSTSSLWTRSNNERARRLYGGRGYSLTDDVKYLRDQEIVRYELQIEGSF